MAFFISNAPHKIYIFNGKELFLMKIFYQLSPLLIFSWAYFLWNKLDRFSVASAANGLIMMIFSLLVALIPTVPVYYARKRKLKRSFDDLIDGENDTPTVQFYTIWSAYTFYIGLALMLVSTYFVKFK